MPLAVDLENRTHVFNTTGWQPGMGHGTAMPHTGGGQAANAQMANHAVNALASFLRGLTLQGQAAGLAARQMAPGPAQGQGQLAQMAQVSHHNWQPQ